MIRRFAPFFDPFRPGPRGRSCRFWTRASGVMGLAMAVLLCIVPGRGIAGGKIDTSAFNAYYGAQSRTLHGHMAKIVAVYSDLAGRGAVGPMKDVLAVRASLAACWELFLNAGDMVYLYDRIDPSCEKTVKEVGGLMTSGLSVVAGKMEKELQWFAISAKNLVGQPISAELEAAEREYRDTAAALRGFAASFAKPVTVPGDPGQKGGPARQGSVSGPAAPTVPAPRPVTPPGTSGRGLSNATP